MPWLPLAILLIVALTAAALLLIIFPPGEDPVPTVEVPAAGGETEEVGADASFAAEDAPVDILPPPGESDASPAPSAPPTTRPPATS